MDKDRVLDELHSTSAPNSVLEAVAEVYARAERLEAENASLERSLVSAMDQIHESDKQLERSEADLAALRARVEAAPVALMDTRVALGLCALVEDDFPALYALQGKRVRLLVESGDE